MEVSLPGRRIHQLATPALHGRGGVSSEEGDPLARATRRPLWTLHMAAHGGNRGAHGGPSENLMHWNAVEQPKPHQHGHRGIGRINDTGDYKLAGGWDAPVILVAELPPPPERSTCLHLPNTSEPTPANLAMVDPEHAATPTRDAYLEAFASLGQVEAQGPADVPKTVPPPPPLGFHQAPGRQH